MSRVVAHHPQGTGHRGGPAEPARPGPGHSLSAGAQTYSETSGVSFSPANLLISS